MMFYNLIESIFLQHFALLYKLIDSRPFSRFKFLFKKIPIEKKYSNKIEIQKM